MDVTLHWVGILAAVVAAFVANFVWFGPKTMYPVWARALGKDPASPPGGTESMGLVFGLTVVGSVVQAITLAWLLQATALLYRATDVSLVFGALTGLAIGAGIAAATSLGHRLFAGQGLVVWAIEIGGDLLGLTIMGAVLSFWY
jgi:hypothetical protein